VINDSSGSFIAAIPENAAVTGQSGLSLPVIVEGAF
jgi:hypothetical protein